MKNLNEEAEILSHDEKLQLKSNPIGNQGEKIIPQNHVNHEGNNLNQGQKIDVSNNNNQNEHYKLKINNHNLNQMNMYGMNNMHHHHQHPNEHDFSNPRYLLHLLWIWL